VKPFVLAPTPAQLGKAPLQRRQSQGNCIPLGFGQATGVSVPNPLRTESKEHDVQEKIEDVNISLAEPAPSEKRASESEFRAGDQSLECEDGSGELTICETGDDSLQIKDQTDEEGHKEGESECNLGLKGFFKKSVEDGMEK